MEGKKWHSDRQTDRQADREADREAILLISISQEDEYAGEEYQQQGIGQGGERIAEHDAQVPYTHMACMHTSVFERTKHLH